MLVLIWWRLLIGYAIVCALPLPPFPSLPPPSLPNGEREGGRREGRREGGEEGGREGGREGAGGDVVQVSKHYSECHK